MAEIIKALVDKNRTAIQERLPKYLTAPQFFQLCYALDKNPKLAAVAQRNPESVLNAILKASDCGLFIGSAAEHCWMIPYGDEVQLQIGWKGFVFQWLRAGAIISIDAQCVYNGDHIEVSGGDNPKIAHDLKLDDPRRDDYRWMYDPKNIVGAYAIATLPTGGKARRYCAKGEIEFAHSRSPGAAKPDSPWRTNYPAMARKTPIRRLNGVIQVCGPTPENQEAWERYNRSLELDRNDFRVVEDDEVTINLNPEEDLPGARSSKKASPPPQETPPRAQAEPVARPAAKRGSDSPSGPPPVTDDLPFTETKVEPPPTTEVKTIDTKTQDDLVEQAGMAHMKPSQLYQFAKETYGVTDFTHLTDAQANDLSKELRRRIHVA